MHGLVIVRQGYFTQKMVMRLFSPPPDGLEQRVSSRVAHIQCHSSTGVNKYKGACLVSMVPLKLVPNTIYFRTISALLIILPLQ